MHLPIFLSAFGLLINTINIPFDRGANAIGSNRAPKIIGDDLDFLNKRAVFVYLREMSGLNPKQLTTTMSSIKKKYREIKDHDEYYAIFG